MYRILLHPGWLGGDRFAEPVIQVALDAEVEKPGLETIIGAPRRRGRASFRAICDAVHTTSLSQGDLQIQKSLPDSRNRCICVFVPRYACFPGITECVGITVNAATLELEKEVG
jgi:hypothetical protein